MHLVSDTVSNDHAMDKTESILEKVYLLERCILDSKKLDKRPLQIEEFLRLVSKIEFDASTSNLSSLVRIIYQLESVLIRMRNDDQINRTHMIDLLLRSCHRIVLHLNDKQEGPATDFTDLIQEMGVVLSYD